MVLGNYCWPNFIAEGGRGVLEERVYRNNIREVDHLRERLIEEWNNFHYNIVKAIEQWRKASRINSYVYIPRLSVFL